MKKVSNRVFLFPFFLKFYLLNFLVKDNSCYLRDFFNLEKNFLNFNSSSVKFLILNEELFFFIKKQKFFSSFSDKKWLIILKKTVLEINFLNFQFIDILKNKKNFLFFSLLLKDNEYFKSFLLQHVLFNRLKKEVSIIFLSIICYLFLILKLKKFIVFFLSLKFFYSNLFLKKKNFIFYFSSLIFNKQIFLVKKDVFLFFSVINFILQKNSFKIFKNLFLQKRIVSILNLKVLFLKNSLKVENLVILINLL